MKWSAWRSATVGMALVIVATAGADAQRRRPSSTDSDSAGQSQSAPAESANEAAAGPAPAAETSGGAEAPQQPPPPAVTYVTLSQQDVTLTARLPGRVVASGMAEVRPQVDGIIEQRLFEEGGDVTLGDPMYRIDPASYDASVAAARAQVAQAQAGYDAALREADRTTRLQDRGVVSEQGLETAIANRDTTNAALQVAKANLQAAEIDLDRTTIRAQLTGVVGRSLTTQGALVTAGQASPLAVIRAIDPVLVDVTQSAAELLEFRRGKLEERLGDADLSVQLHLADGTTYDQTGELTAAEPYVDEQTGVVTLRLEFANPDRLLLPGMYVQVAMPQGVVENAVLAPQEGVTRDRRGRPIAYVVNADNVIEARQITIANANGANWVVTDGLRDGDRMVVEGFQRIAPGATVRAQERVPDDEDKPAAALVAPSEEAVDSRTEPVPLPDVGPGEGNAADAAGAAGAQEPEAAATAKGGSGAEAAAADGTDATADDQGQTVSN